MPEVCHRTRSVLAANLLRGESFIDRIDPRSRVVGVGLFAILTSVAQRSATVVLILGLSVVVVFAARLTIPAVLRRLVPLNLLVLCILFLMPWTSTGTPLFSIGTYAYTREGLRTALLIGARGNAVMLMVIVWLTTLDVTTLGHALAHLRVPEKLIHLLLFTVRYIDLLEREYQRMAAALKVRGFRPRMSRHLYRTYGNMVGMLLVRSLDRSERVMAAMKCRGYRGRFYLLDHFAFSSADRWFGLIVLTLFFLGLFVEWR